MIMVWGLGNRARRVGEQGVRCMHPCRARQGAVLSQDETTLNPPPLAPDGEGRGGGRKAEENRVEPKT